MDKISTKILKAMNSAQPDPADRYYNWHEDLEKLAAIVEETVPRTEAAIRWLIENGFVTDCKNQFQTSVCFVLSQSGLAFRERNRKERRMRWMERLLAFACGVLMTVLAEIVIDFIRSF